MLLALAALAAALCAGALLLRGVAERAIRGRIEAEAARAGFVARIGKVRVGVWPPVRVTGLVFERAGGWRLSAGTVDGWWAGGTRLDIREARAEGRAGLSIAAGSTSWDVSGLLRHSGELRLALRPASALVVNRTAAGGEDAWTIDATDLEVGRLVEVRRFDRLLLDGGTIVGHLGLSASDQKIGFEVDLRARSARLPGLAGEAGSPGSLGAPTELSMSLAGAWRRPDGTLEIPNWTGTIAGAALSGSLAVRDLGSEASVDLKLDMERVDFARLLKTSGLEIPESLGAEQDLGTASLAASARGRLSEPASFVVTQKLDFTPPARMPRAIERLRGDFVHEVQADTGPGPSIAVSPSSPDFIPLSEVPPLFLRALLLAEDAGFYGHPGIDLRELPAAILTDWERRGAARGASTITQQLAKNLFLSGEKKLGRKLQELSITLLLEAALGKTRILEIYVNIIQWGPGLHGLRPAARAYFDREPRDLTPAQIAFLVSLIPAPIKYQTSFAHGTPGPGLRQLIDALLAKLRSVDALTEDEYRQALDEPIVVRGRESS
jgi:hypothetical protein